MDSKKFTLKISFFKSKLSLIFRYSFFYFFNLLISPLLCLYLHRRVVLLSEKGRLSLTIPSIESELRLLKYWNNSNLNDIIFIVPFEIPNKFLLNQYSNYCRIIYFNLHEVKGVKKMFLTFIWFLLSASAHPNGFIRIYQTRLSEKDHLLWQVLPPILKNIEFDNLVESLEYITLTKYINLNQPFCVLAYRQQEYYNKYISAERSPQSDIIYSSRNPNFNSYIPFIEHLINNGIQVIRVGLSSSPVIYERNGFYDFSGKGYNEKLDIYLASKCLFAIVGACGYFAQVKIFNKLIYNTHAYSYREILSGWQGFTLPSKYRKDGIDLNVDSALKIDTSKPLESNTILVPPTSEEILFSGLNFIDYLNGSMTKNYIQNELALTLERNCIYSQPLIADHWLTNNRNLL